MKQISIFIFIVVLIGLLFVGSSLVLNFNRNRVTIVQAQAAIEQARAVQEAARAAQIASAGQTTVSTLNALLFGMVLVSIIGFAATFVYLRFFRTTRQPVERVHIPSAPSERLPQVDPQQAMLQQMTQMLLLELLGRYTARLSQQNPDNDA